MKYFKILTFLTIVTQWTVGDAQKKFNWKRVKPNIHKRLTLYGVVDVCGVSRGVEPLYPGELRAHNCDLLQCRKTVDGLEKWACEDCVPDTPDCIEYQNRRLRRNLSKKAERRAARSRKEKYRRMKRAAILAERKASKQKRLAEKEAKKKQKEGRISRKEEKASRKAERAERRRHRHEKKLRRNTKSES